MLAELNIDGPRPPGPVQLREPLELDPSGNFATVAQDGGEDLRQCVLAILATPVGWRVELPEFGTPSQAFRIGGADLAEVERCIRLWDDRVDVDAMRASGDLERYVDHVRVKIGGRSA